MKNLPVCQECQEYQKLTSVPRMPRIWQTYQCAKVPSRPCHGSWRPQGWAQGCQGWWPACWSWPSGYLRWVFLLFPLLVSTRKVGCQIRLVREHPGEHAEKSGWPQQRNGDLFYRSLLIDRCATAFTWGAIRLLKNMVSPSIQHNGKDSKRHHYQNVLASEDDCNLWICATIWIYATMYRFGWE